MEQTKPKFAKYLFVCENVRQDKASCTPASLELRTALKQVIHERGFGCSIRVSRSGCLDACSNGPNILLMPDNIMFHHVSVGDISRIVGVAIAENAH